MPKAFELYRFTSAGAEADAMSSWSTAGPRTAAECLDFDSATRATIG